MYRQTGRVTLFDVGAGKLFFFLSIYLFAIETPICAVQLDPGLSGPLEFKEFQKVEDRYFGVRSLGTMRVTNRRGAIRVQGWALDKVRVRAIYYVSATTERMAAQRFSTLGIQYVDKGGDLEVGALYGKGLGIRGKLRERNNPQGRIDLEIRAPSQMDLHVWAMKGPLTIRDWNASVSARSSEGSALMRQIEGKQISLSCDGCKMVLEEIKGDLHLRGGDESLSLSSVEGDRVYVEANKGDIQASDVHADQLFVTEGGSIVGKRLVGSVEFRSSEGNIEMWGTRGEISGKTRHGKIDIQVGKWIWNEKSFIESLSGDIHLIVPKSFGADLDAQSSEGKVSILGPLNFRTTGETYGPPPPNHKEGMLGKGGGQMRVRTKTGNIVISGGGT